MLLIDDKPLTPMQRHWWFSRRRGFKPVHKRLRIYVGTADRMEPLWKWRGSMFLWNKRRKPRRVK